MNSLFIGRFSPFHAGHKKLIDTVLNEGKSVVIAVRDTKISDKNPYTVEERIKMIRDAYDGDGRVQVIAIPDISEVCYGRDVGWSVREIRLDAKTEAISATKVRGNESTKRALGFTVWLTGLPSSGKSTIARSLVEELSKVRQRVELLDADVIRKTLWPELGYSKEDRDKNIDRATWLASTLTRHGVAVVTSFISPYREVRQRARDRIGEFIEVYVKCSLDVCVQRDVKGLYKRAINGEIDDFTGISAPYEEPDSPEVVVSTDEEDVGTCVRKIMDKTRELGYI
ncbi:MAG: adenylyl-sulfate kinase [Candidatus Thorarchaeota archaeon]